MAKEPIVQVISRSSLLATSEGRHFASEPHVRIQVLRLPRAKQGPPRDLFSGYHGELLVICLDGRCRVETEGGGHDLSAHDQAFLADGEPFRVLALDDRDAVVEMVWAPGPNPCRTCWERDSKFFR